jgi:hypothetical protein
MQDKPAEPAPSAPPPATVTYIVTVPDGYGSKTYRLEATDQADARHQIKARWRDPWNVNYKALSDLPEW